MRPQSFIQSRKLSDSENYIPKGLVPDSSFEEEALSRQLYTSTKRLYLTVRKLQAGQSQVHT